MVCDYLQLEDFYAAGIGFDLGGAFLLARGLINKPVELTRISVAFYDSNRFIAVNVAKNRLDAIAGVTGLAVGFTLQATGYVALLWTPHRTGAKEALTGVLLAVLAAVATVVCGTIYRSRGVVPLLVEMSHYTADERMPYPRATILPGAALHADAIRRTCCVVEFHRRTVKLRNPRSSSRGLPQTYVGRPCEAQSRNSVRTSLAALS